MSWTLASTSRRMASSDDIVIGVVDVGRVQELKPAAAVSPDAAASPTKAARCSPR